MAISIHAPARGATYSPNTPHASVENFNSRPCERGDLEHLAEKRLNY